MEQMKIMMIVGTPDEIEQVVRHNIGKDTQVPEPRVDVVIMATGADGVFGVMLKVDYAKDLEIIKQMGFTAMREFTALTPKARNFNVVQ